mmetsp:Transcript_38873/g.116882  ORF Transcript_38873/g.116882 Transcript_38873/m.116882 type:complete len:89 (+) Transcript_38873:122-388(+)|eukprot:CAMPEP_0113538690 /NCGR_PEP_ID=MMETSP0015_2-20120614/7504_1 /TAXON_ID=2838 /ORGANISM="Odontella" /LENGTH=88 /DNA_ID=CAMNT_0000438289 /DNA_START=179 /DNA_END=445 /DNA_ORIENTATION=+ /assembly_acc=CAM_ASM_000160
MPPLPRSIRNRNEKYSKNVTKRGQVPIGKAADHEDEFPVSKPLIAFFMFVVIGSSLVQILNLFSKGAPPIGEDPMADAGQQGPMPGEE